MSKPDALAGVKPGTALVVRGMMGEGIVHVAQLTQRWAIVNQLERYSRRTGRASATTQSLVLYGSEAVARLATPEDIAYAEIRAGNRVLAVALWRLADRVRDLPVTRPVPAWLPRLRTVVEEVGP